MISRTYETDHQIILGENGSVAQHDQRPVSIVDLGYRVEEWSSHLAIDCIHFLYMLYPRM